MIPFLKQVACRYHEEGKIANSCFIFPNRRSEVFFMKYLAECLPADRARGLEVRPVTAPDTCTINDFMYRVYDAVPTDRIALLLKLYEVYVRLYPKAESLDDFIFWGDVIINDFNDVDKYLADARQLFANVSDFKAIQDTFSYLSDTQREALDRFIRHFRDEAGRMSVDLEADHPGVKARFLMIWNILYRLYEDFRSSLREEGMAYEGMVYREVAELFGREGAEEVLRRHFPEAGRFVFVGLNALNECEKKVLRTMKDEGIAEFCWDYEGSLIRDSYNKSSFFMEGNISQFGQDFHPMEEVSGKPEVEVVSVPSAVGQVKLLPGIFRQIASRKEEVGLSTAIVLPDERLLMHVLNTVPPDIRDINVTMGYPMSESEFHAYMDLVLALQMNLRRKGDRWYFHHRQVASLQSCPIFRKAAGPDALALLTRLKSEGLLYIPQERFSGDAFLRTVFRPVIREKSRADKASVLELEDYLQEVIGQTALGLKGDPSYKLELEFAREWHVALSSLRQVELEVQPQTCIRLLQQILSGVSVPFKGEPLKGLQVMGPLETRALDFDNIIILTCNEGVFPRKSISSSFIPPELRKGFGLPTYEYQDSVWAYYFYRLLTRAGHVWMICDSRTEGVKSGEESRYIRQLQYHFDQNVKRSVMQASLSGASEELPVRKTPEDLDRIGRISFSATALQTWLNCPVRFYYHYVKELYPEDEVKEVLDNGLFGSIYHNLMQALYLGNAAMEADLDMDDRNVVEDFRRSRPEMRWPYRLPRTYLEHWLSREDLLRQKVKSMIMKKLHTLEVTGRNLVVADVILHYVLQTLRRDIGLMDARGVDHLEIIGLERSYSYDFHGHHIYGYIDRLDRIPGGEVRVVDYKTGTVKDNDCAISDANAREVVDALFGTDNARRPTIALQLYIYDKFMQQDQSLSGEEVHNCIYSTMKLFEKIPESYPVSPEFVQAVDAKLLEVFRQMEDPDVPFTRTDDPKTCEYCEFKMICGR